MELLEREGALAVLAEAHDDAAHGDGRVAVVVGYGALRGLSQDALAWPLGFAAGAVLASLADTLVPAAYEEGGPVGGVVHGARLPPLVPRLRHLAGR